ncbi:hypothetical protein H5154_22005 [Pseudoalteromonas sp. SR44-5]|uniref:hypothetical protein n=1 Tax=Pseudoalteromonas sp. SR44-5 TaxID=2760934 RepID=UPI0016013C54|nr:hypothetical protein [Pseudoalteromonas sp. SR44-5]MBB1369016.1 hypothetical protein [Pseudoalteromonas sp. SR44-5]
MNLLLTIVLTSLFKWLLFEYAEPIVATLSACLITLSIAGYYLYLGFKQITFANELYNANDALKLLKLNLVQILWLITLPIIGFMLYKQNLIGSGYFIDLFAVMTLLTFVLSWTLITTASNSFKRLEAVNTINNRVI